MDRQQQYEQWGRRQIRKPNDLHFFHPMLCNTIYGVVLRENQHVARDALPGYSLFVPE